MTDSSQAAPKVRRTGRPGLTLAVEREIRLVAGLVLMVFVTSHLLNHAIGVFGVDAMVAVQSWRVWAWQSWPGVVLLYGAAALHVALALKRIVGRRTWRMPWREAAQIALGLMIPLLIVDHIVGSRVLPTFHGTKNSYFEVLTNLWPANAVPQIVLVLVVWFHGVIGVNYAFRSKDWFVRVRDIGAVLAFVIPLLAIWGFISAGREVLEFDVPTAVWTEVQRMAFRRHVANANMAFAVIGGLLLATALAIAAYRRFSRKIIVQYRGHGEVEAVPGLTLLEISRASGIPHPSHCGGRARCSTCRVLVLEGQERLAPPGPLEAKLLKRISAPARVRLACQMRPSTDVGVQILLPIASRPGMLDWEEETYKWGVDRDVTVLFVDVRGFTALTRNQVPADLVIMLNRILAELTQAIEGHGGRVGMYLSDGVMGVFGLGATAGNGARMAIRAARDLLKSVQALDVQLASALPMPLRIGIGIHTGRAVIARVGDDERGYMVTALGETVSVAARLEAATKELLADVVISDETIRASGLSISGQHQREVHVRDRSTPVIAHAFADLADLGGLSAKAGEREQPEGDKEKETA